MLLGKALIWNILEIKIIMLESSRAYVNIKFNWSEQLYSFNKPSQQNLLKFRLYVQYFNIRQVEIMSLMEAVCGNNIVWDPTL